jgi:hypothetical protein
LGLGSGFVEERSADEVTHLRGVPIAPDDTITSERTYKKARTPEDAFLELERCASNQFDPALVRVFIETMRRSPRQTVEVGVNTSVRPSDSLLA